MSKAVANIARCKNHSKTINDKQKFVPDAGTYNGATEGHIAGRGTELVAEARHKLHVRVSFNTVQFSF